MTEAANLDSVKEVVNEWREATGQDIMAAWFPSQPGSAQKCLLARAFNLNCQVSYDSELIAANAEPTIGKAYPPKLDNGEFDTEADDKWAFTPDSGEIAFELENDAEQFAGITGYERISERRVALPDEVALIAWEFDNGSYAEYAVSPNENA